MSVCLLRLAIAALIALALPAGARAETDFLRYLSAAAPAPAMIAFNPSTWDPDRPAGQAVTADSLRADLAALRPAFDGLILYAYDPVRTPAIVAEAAAQGYRAILLGIWNPGAAAEIEGTAALIDAFRGRLALAVCIGNEGINDNRYTIDRLQAAARRLATLQAPAAPVPVTTSEPGGDYGWPLLRAFGGFLAPNIHPAIERPGQTPEAAAAWAQRRALAIARVAGKPVLVKETGWPNGGSPPFTPAAQAGFWHAWLADGRAKAVSADGWVSFAAGFEAFDAPWKAQRLRNPVEGHWGLMASDRTPYPAFAVWQQAGR